MEYSDNIVTREILDTIRSLKENKAVCSERRLVNEDNERRTDTSDAIAITDDPKFGQNVLTNQIMQFRTTVESSTQFAKVDENNISECPLIYIPSTGNLIFSGIIPTLNNLKFQFVLKTNTGNGCFIWADSMILNRENIQVLQKMWGFYVNWKESWIAESADLERMAEHWKNS